MTKEEIKHLGQLSRIALTDTEAETFNQEIDSILEYVSVVKNIAGDNNLNAKALGARYNVLRADTITNTPGEYTDAMLAGMPHTQGQFMAVKKILKQID